MTEFGPTRIGGKDMRDASTGAYLVPGLLAGLLGGIAMTACIMLAAAIQGLDMLAPLRPMGETFAGSEPRSAGAAALAYGFARHLVFSGAMGVLLAPFMPRDFPPGSASLMGVAFAFIVMAFMASLVLPAVNPALRAAMPALGGSWVLAHAAYGLTLGFSLQCIRRNADITREARARGVREPT